LKSASPAGYGTAESDEDAWRPSTAPSAALAKPHRPGKIAVKIISHCGDEVLSVYECRPIAEGSRSCRMASHDKSEVR